MSASGLSTLAGALAVRPGGALPSIHSTRREMAPLLGRGKPAALLPDLLGAVFTLCGGAHRVAARHAVNAALHGGAEPDAAQRQALQVDTLREHLRRLWLDAPRTVPGASAPDVSQLAACALLQRADALDDSRAWIEHQVLGQGSQAWLQGWQADPRAHAAAWSDAGASWPARWLAAARQLGLNLRQPVVALQAHASALELRRLAGQLRHEAEFALAPTWRGHTAETGCWTRLADRTLQGADSPAAELWLRQAARVADIARLLAPGGEQWLSQGALATGDREGLGWCEMARGLLIHWVRLDAEGRVADCRLIAPTEWNFHPFGPAARALALLPAQASDARVRLLVAAYDPCVAVDIQREGEASHA